MTTEAPRPKGGRPRRGLGLPWLVLAMAVGLWTLLRLGLFVMTGPAQAGWGHLPLILLKGLWFDLAAGVWLAAPLLLLGALAPDRWRTSRAGRALRILALWVLIGLILSIAASEIAFWQEFSTRLNFIAVDYLVYTQEVMDNIRESYPVGLIFGGIGLAAAALAWVAARRWLAPPVPRTGRRRLGALALALVLPLASLGLSSVDQMSGLGNAYADELSGNGPFCFFAAFRRNGLDYDRFYRTLPQAECDRILAGLGVERPPLAGPAPAAPALPDPLPPAAADLQARPRNIVLISVESLSAEFLGCYGDTRGLTPNLDRIAKEGLRFTQFFATGTRTVRGLEALSLGTPPIPGQAIVRRPGSEGLSTVGEFAARQGIQPIFLYGGYGYFDNMNAYFAGNAYQVVDRTDFPEVKDGFANAWGVADEQLFDNALAAMDREDRQGRRFFAHIMTTSNHRPFTYPDGRIDIPSPGGRSGSVKYTDWALGRFLDMARSARWFKDTVFVIVADHCASAAGKTSVPVKGFHIPLIIYGPGLIRPGEDATVSSQMDLPPTLLDLLGAKGKRAFFGRSLFGPMPSEPRAFLANYQDLGYYKRGILTVLKPKRAVEAYRIDPATYAATPAPPDPELLQEAIAYYESGTHAFDQGALKLPPAP